MYVGVRVSRRGRVAREAIANDNRNDNRNDKSQNTEITDYTVTTRISK